METTSNTGPVEKQQTGNLKSLVKDLIKGLVHTTTRNNSFVVNDIPADLKLAADAEVVAAVLGNLFNSVATHASESCIRVTAKAYSDVILVQVRDHSIHTSTMAYNLVTTQQIAERIGGFLGVTSQWKNKTVVVFSFPNMPAAA